MNADIKLSNDARNRGLELAGHRVLPPDRTVSYKRSHLAYQTFKLFDDIMKDPPRRRILQRFFPASEEVEVVTRTEWERRLTEALGILITDETEYGDAREVTILYMLICINGYLQSTWWLGSRTPHTPVEWNVRMTRRLNELLSSEPRNKDLRAFVVPNTTDEPSYHFFCHELMMIEAKPTANYENAITDAREAILLLGQPENLRQVKYPSVLWVPRVDTIMEVVSEMAQKGLEELIERLRNPQEVSDSKLNVLGDSDEKYCKVMPST